MASFFVTEKSNRSIGLNYLGRFFTVTNDLMVRISTSFNTIKLEMHLVF